MPARYGTYHGKCLPLSAHKNLVIIIIITLTFDLEKERKNEEKKEEEKKKPCSMNRLYFNCKANLKVNGEL